MHRFDSFEYLTLTSSQTKFNLKSIKMKVVLCLEMENKIPGLSFFNYDANISDYYGNSSSFSFSLSDVDFSVWRH